MECSNFLVPGRTKLSTRSPFKGHFVCVLLAKSPTNRTFLALIYLKLLTMRLQAQYQKVFLIAWLLFSAVSCVWRRIFVSSSKVLEAMEKVVLKFFVNTQNFLCLNMNINIYLKARALSGFC